jgi:DNA-binding response OmpR family regulator
MNEAIQTGSGGQVAAARIVLLIDDDPLVLKAYGDAMRRRGYQVETAADGLEAMKLVMALKPDLVVLDLFMPKVEGKYVLKFIRSQAELKFVRVIVLSEASLSDAAQPALALSPDLVLHKSDCTASLLADKIKELLETANPSVPDPHQ